MEGATGEPTDVRGRAIQSLKKKRAFRAHLFAIWAVGGREGSFWPIWPILGWGIGIGINAWDVYGRRPISEDEIGRETERLRGNGGNG